MSLIYTERCNIVVYPDRCTRSYLHNSQAQLLLMGMHVENTVKKLELVVLVFLEIYKVRGPSHLSTRTYIHSCSWVTTKCTTVQVLSALWDLHSLQLLPEQHQTAGTTTYVLYTHMYCIWQLWSSIMLLAPGSFATLLIIMMMTWLTNVIMSCDKSPNLLCVFIIHAPCFNVSTSLIV